MVLIRMQLASCKQEVLGQVTIIIGSVSSSLVLTMADEQDMCTRVDEDLCGLSDDEESRGTEGVIEVAHICSIFNAGIEFDPADIC